MLGIHWMFMGQRIRIPSFLKINKIDKTGFCIYSSHLFHKIRGTFMNPCNIPKNLELLILRIQNTWLIELLDKSFAKTTTKILAKPYTPAKTFLSPFFGVSLHKHEISEGGRLTAL